MTKRIMIVGAGAREHAIARAYLRDGGVEVLVTPGNKGMERDGILTDASVNHKNPESVLNRARLWKPYLIDVAQDNALEAGTVDKAAEFGMQAFGPTRAAARIEWDKVWARQLMTKYHIPCPVYHIFDQKDPKAITCGVEIIQQGKTAFFKARGLYEGKGVVSASEIQGVFQAFERMQGMGKASEQFLIEEGEVGEEFSYYALVDGKNVLCLKSAQDNKRIFDDDKGDMTGGMGAHAPALITQGLEEKIEEEIVSRTVEGLIKEGTPYTGWLYVGGMVLPNKELKVIEFNSRLGDPECHVLLPGIQNKYLDLVEAALAQRLDQVKLVQDDLARICIIGASLGYPGSYEKGKRVAIDYDNLPAGTHVLSAGIGMNERGELVTIGGRIFSVVAEAETIIEAMALGYQAMECCQVEGGFQSRSDIGLRDVYRMTGTPRNKN